MRIAAFTDYGLRALMRLSMEPSRLFTTGEMAEELEISHHHLAKIVRTLADAGYLTTQRGAGGGFRLARPSSEIAIGDVVRLLESRYPIVECFRKDGGRCTLTSKCALKVRLRRAADAFLAELNRSSLDECLH